jgi:hypothetical protein
MHSTNKGEEMLNGIDEIKKVTGYSHVTIQDWHLKGVDCPINKVGEELKVRKDKLLAWMQGRGLKLNVSRRNARRH